MTARAADHKYADHNTLVGMTEKRGKGYHFYGTPNNSYPAGVPLDAIRSRLLNWEVNESPLYVNGPGTPDIDPTQGQMWEVPGQKALVASDTGEVLGIHGDTRPTRQYSEVLLDWASQITDSPDLVVGSVGFLKGRRQMWINIEMAETMQVPGTDLEFRPYLLGAYAHDASIALTFKALNELLVCGNMVSGLLRNNAAPKYKLRSTRNSTLNVSNAREALGIIHQNSEQFIAEIQGLMERDFSERAFSRLLDLAAPKPKDEEANKRGTTVAEKKREDLTQLWKADPMAAPWNGTAFGAFQALNTYAHHISAVKGENTRAERNLARTVKEGTGSVEKMDQELIAMVDRAYALA